VSHFCSLARLARWIRHDETLPERERIQDFMDKIREKYPVQAKAADDWVNSLSFGYIIEEVPFGFVVLLHASTINKY
jgi:hypothetical protein